MDIKRLLCKGIRIVCNPPAVTNSIISKKAKVCSGSQINNTEIQRYSYVGNNCFCLNAKIGPFCSIADFCRIGGSQHPLERVSTSPVFYKGRNVFKTHFAEFDATSREYITIGADVWIGASATIISGVSIGTGAVIGAGSVVTKDVPAYEIWAGNPAKKIRDRFDPNTRDSLLSSEWWNWDEEKLKTYASSFNDPNKLLESLVRSDEGGV